MTREGQIVPRPLLLTTSHSTPLLLETRSTQFFLKSPDASSLAKHEHQAIYSLAQDALVRRTSHEGQVTEYQPYFCTIDGAEGRHEVASSYTSVEINGRRAWFEVLQSADAGTIHDVQFLTSHPLSLILAEEGNPDVQRLSQFLQRPQAGRALIRVVNQQETPAHDGVERVVDPQELQEAARKVAEHITEPRASSPRRYQPEITLPTIEELSHNEDFEPYTVAENGVQIGMGRKLTSRVGDDETRDLFVYPAITPDGAKTYLLSTEEIPQQAKEIPQDGKTIVGREDTICTCEKFGRRVLNHSCGHELLGSLQHGSETREAHPIVIAWDPAGDAYANGSIMHALKRNNVARLSDSGILPQLSELYERELALEDRRNFLPLAQTLATAAHLLGADHISFQSTNPSKKQALENALAEVSENITYQADPHEHWAVPAGVRQQEANNGERPHKYGRRTGPAN